jgi:hypothetical protein
MASKFLKGVDLNNQRGINVADPTGNTDVANKQYVDNLVAGLSWKDEVKAASTANVTLASPGTTLDGYTLQVNDRILLKDQSTASQNGIYVWTASGSALTRATDANTTAKLEDAAVFVANGTVNADRAYVQSATVTTVDTTNQTWAQFGGSSTQKTAGSGLTETGSTYDVGAGTGITVAADTVAVDTAVVVRKFAASCVVTTNPQTFAHGLGTADLTVTIRESANVVYPDVSVDTTNVTVDWGAAPTAAQYRVIAHG